MLTVKSNPILTEKEQFHKIIRKLKINESLKRYILLQKKDLPAIQSDDKSIWDLFFQEIENNHTLSDNNLKMILISEIRHTLCFDYNIIFFKKGFWLIKINILMKHIYEGIRNRCKFQWFQIMTAIMSALSKYFKIEKIDQLLFNKHHVKTWCLLIQDSDIQIIKQFENVGKGSFIYFDKEMPPSWRYLDEKNVILRADNRRKPNITTLGKYIQDTHILSLFTKDLISYINELQKIKYTLDRKLFIDLFKNINLLDFYKPEKSSIIIIDDYENYLLNNMGNYLLDKDKDESRFLKLVTKLVFKKPNLVKRDYTNVISDSDKGILNFLYNYDKKVSLRHNIFMDYRGRMYILGNISYISSKLLRCLVVLDEGKEIVKNDFYKYYVACLIKKPKSIAEGKLIYDKRYKYKKKIKNNMYYLKIVKYCNGNISLDATASMMQIISLLTKSTKLMKYTNLTVSDIRYDIYEYLIEVITDKNYKVKDNLTFKDEKGFYNVFINYFKSKKLYKYCIMLYVYGSTPLYTAKSYLEINKIKSIHIKDLTYIISIIVNCFKDEFKSVQLIKSFIKTYTDLIKYETHYEFNTLLKRLSYSCPQGMKININFKNINSSFNTDSQSSSYEKKIRSSFVNIIHSLDSEICILTRIKLLKEFNINSLSIHDCFLVHINDYEKCLYSYNSSMSKILDLNLDQIINNIYKNKDEFLNKWKPIYYSYLEENNKFLEKLIGKLIGKANKYAKLNDRIYEAIRDIPNIAEENLNNVRGNKNLMEALKTYLDEVLEKNYEKYLENKKKLLGIADFKKEDFDSKNIKYSLKPQ